MKSWIASLDVLLSDVYGVLLPALNADPANELQVGCPHRQDVGVAVLRFVRHKFCEAPLPQLVQGLCGLRELDDGTACIALRASQQLLSIA